MHDACRCMPCCVQFCDFAFGSALICFENDPGGFVKPTLECIRDMAFNLSCLVVGVAPYLSGGLCD